MSSALLAGDIKIWRWHFQVHGNLDEGQHCCEGQCHEPAQEEPVQADNAQEQKHLNKNCICVT